MWKLSRHAGLAVVALAHRVAPQHQRRREVRAADEQQHRLGAELPHADGGRDDAVEADADRVPARPEVAGDQREEREAVDARERVERLVEVRDQALEGR